MNIKSTRISARKIKSSQVNPSQVTHNDVQHGRELGEQQYFVSASEQRVQQTVEQKHLATRVDEVLVDDVVARLGVDGPVEEERVRRDLAELHDEVLQVHVVDLLG